MSDQTLRQLARLPDTIRIMTEAFRLECLSTGCEPTCHFCDKLLLIDDHFGFRRLGEARMERGVFLPTAVAMGCENCVINATPEQVAHARGDMTIRLPTPGDARAALVNPAKAKEVGRGCFVTDDGNVF